MEQAASARVPASPSSSSNPQVCDRCRWKKIKCDVQNGLPCSSCRSSNFPCESRVRLNKQSTPRSYVQYLEARVRQLENGQDNDWSPKPAPSYQSPYSDATSHVVSASPASSSNFVNDPLDWTVLKELGIHVLDEDGCTRYMGPSSGVGFSAMALQEILGGVQPAEPYFNGLFTVDDFNRARALEQADHVLFDLVPTELPARQEADRILNYYFVFTERVFPILHRPSFQAAVEELYSRQPMDVASFERLAQFFFCLSVGYCFDLSRSRDERIRDQIRTLEMGRRCHFTTLHTRREGLTRLQTIGLQAYALIMLRQRSEALRISAIANTKALEIGLHHDGNRFAGNPLDTEMRRRVFWCVFMLHLFTSAFLGLPRTLHEADITIAEPSDIDDECLSTTRVLNAVPGRTKIHRFVTVCRLIRILSRTLDVLYSHNKRKHASTRIEQMNRLCCDHLLDQLDFGFDEVPNDLPSADTQDPLEMAIVISHANEQLLYHYIRWLIHRPGLALPRAEPQFASCLQNSTEAASAMLQLLDKYAHLLPFIKSSPVAHPMAIFIAALTPLFRTHLLRMQPMTIPAPSSFMGDDLEATQHGIGAIRNEPYDEHDLFRVSLLESMVSKMFGDDVHQVKVRQASNKEQVIVNQASISLTPRRGHNSGWSEHRIAHLTAQEDLRDLVHDVFSPAMQPWSSGMDPGQHG